jgi:thiamine transport system ATP-binding protein
MLSVENATVRFGGKVALDGVSLVVRSGEILGVLGPSGSGKSTLLRAIAGLEPLASGTIRWGGDDLRAVPPHRRGFALMFQDGQLFPHKDVAGNVGYALRLVRHPTLHERVAELLDLVGLPGFEKRRVTDLSGGEQQRVALARALAASPRLLLLDEPLSSLDRELRERLAVDLRDILRAAGTPAILVTHDHTEAGVIADRVGIMDDGRMLQLGTMDDLRGNPASHRVARFLGVA